MLITDKKTTHRNLEGITSTLATPPSSPQAKAAPLSVAAAMEQKFRSLT